MNIVTTKVDQEVSLQDLYRSDEKILDYQRSRYKTLTNRFEDIFKSRPAKYFSSPGRVEISGNHTDHNHGKVIAASINLDSIAAASPNSDNEVVVYSETYSEPFIVDLRNIKPVEKEKTSTKALIRGIAAGFRNNGYNVGGFNAYVSSDVLIGSGLSSSASIEVLIGTIFNKFYNDGKVSGEEIAIIGQFAENNYFGKPCGLMDQIACITGGIVEIDFYNPRKPIIKKIDFDLQATGYKLVVVDTEASHVDLTEDYAAIPEEMKRVAKYFNKEYCSDITLEELFDQIKLLRKVVGDRAILRAIHFLEENKRVEKQIRALNKNNFEVFLSLVNESGGSSYKYLQNIYTPQNVNEQSISLALAISDIFIREKGKGACRVHGGGFAGTIQVFLPKELIEGYKSYISKIFNEDSVKVLSIRNYGVVCLTDL
jgi:galactokinase